nr:Uncharacterised protein [Klebsiella pneumoniae]
MDQLVERVLTVGARLTPDDWASLVVYRVAVTVNILTVGLHVALLEVSGKAVHVLVVRQNRFGFRTEEVVVPDADQSQQHRQVFSAGVVEKCLSIACAPDSSSTKLSKPTERMMDRPIADHRE